MKVFLNKLRLFVGFYLISLITLLLCVIATPIFIQHGISINDKVIIEEEVIEFIMITALIGISVLIFGSFKRTLKTYKSMVDKTKTEKMILTSRLSEAFHYIGSVNSEIHSIQSILCGVNCYPKSNGEFKQIFKHLAAKAATVAAAPWAAIRIINKTDGRTVKEHGFEFVKGALPAATMGNRAILEGRQVEGVISISAHHNNLDLRTVCIVPAGRIFKEESLLITAIANQAEMYFLLYCALSDRQDEIVPYSLHQSKLYHDNTMVR